MKGEKLCANGFVLLDWLSWSNFSKDYLAKGNFVLLSSFTVIWKLVVLFEISLYFEFRVEFVVKLLVLVKEYVKESEVTAYKVLNYSYFLRGH